MNKHYNIVIVGGGMVGLAFASLLDTLPISIAIIEAKNESLTWEPHTHDLRVSAINAASVSLFSGLGIWDAIQTDRVSAYEKMFIWAGASNINFDAESLNETELGFIIENRVIRKHLWNKVMAQSNITMLCPQKIQQIEMTEQGAKIQLSEDHLLSTDLLIAADGAHSFVRQQLHKKMESQPYPHAPLVAILRLEKIHQKTAWQHFLQEGPLAFLPLQDEHNVSIVWSLSPKNSDYFKTCEKAMFEKAVSAAVDHRFGKIELISPRINFELHRQAMECYVAPHLVFIGDAAHRIHPMAGQGVNLGFADALSLADKIRKNITEKKRIDEIGMLYRFQRERKYEAFKLFKLIDGLIDLFSHHHTKKISERGLKWINDVPWIKKWLVGQAQDV